jgi:hypothetical protein
MFKKITFLTIIASLLLIAVPILAEQSVNDSSNVNTNVNSNPPITPLATTVKPAIDVSCIQTALEKRETALIAVIDKYASDVKLLLTARLQALKSAWALTDKKARRAAIKKAWKDYNSGLVKARKGLRDGKNIAWKNYNADKKFCGKGVPAEDYTSASVDNNL